MRRRWKWFGTREAVGWSFTPMPATGTRRKEVSGGWGYICRAAITINRVKCRRKRVVGGAGCVGG